MGGRRHFWSHPICSAVDRISVEIGNQFMIEFDPFKHTILVWLLSDCTSLICSIQKRINTSIAEKRRQVIPATYEVSSYLF